MNARRGFVTQLGMEYETAFERAAAFGLDHVELMMDGATARTRLDDEADDVRAALDEHDLDLLVHLPFGGLDIGSPHTAACEGSVEEIAVCIETAAALGAEKGVLHGETGAWRPAWEDSELRERLFDSIRELDAVGADHDLEVCVENIPGGAVTTHEFDRLFADTSASMTLDTGHARIDGVDAGGVAALVREYPDRISHVHLNDTRQARDEHLPFGAGTIEFERIFEAFREVDWTGTLSLEVFTLDYGYVERSVERLDDLLR